MEVSSSGYLVGNSGENGMPVQIKPEDTATGNAASPAASLAPDPEASRPSSNVSGENISSSPPSCSLVSSFKYFVCHYIICCLTMDSEESVPYQRFEEEPEYGEQDLMTEAPEVQNASTPTVATEKIELVPEKEIAIEPPSRRADRNLMKATSERFRRDEGLAEERFSQTLAKRNIDARIKEATVDLKTSHEEIGMVDLTRYGFRSELIFETKTRMTCLFAAVGKGSLQVKILPNSEEAYEEARLSLSFLHEGIARGICSGNILGDLRIIVFEFTGQPLFTVFEENGYGKRTSRCDEDEAVIFLRNIISGVRFLHRSGIIHHKISCESIFIKGKKAKIADFSGAVGYKQGELFFDQIGQKNYMAPEMMIGSGYCEQVDVYSVGVVFYELLHASKPTSGMKLPDIPNFYEPAEYRLKVREDLKEFSIRILCNLLHLDPGLRWTTEQAFEQCNPGGLPLFKDNQVPVNLAEIGKKKKPSVVLIDSAHQESPDGDKQGYSENFQPGP